MRFAMAAAMFVLGACTGGNGENGTSCHCLLDADLFRPDADTGSMATPHRVSLDGLPFTHTDSTATSTTRAFDSYDCGPDLNQSGSEVWYDLSIDHPVPVRITVTSEPEVNVDLYVLVEGTSGQVATCLAHGDQSLDATIPPGANYLIVDTPRVGDSENAGVYTLRIEAAP